MYAIIEDGSRQLKVEEGQELDIDYRDLPAGEAITFDRVLAVRAAAGLQLGRPALAGATVTAKVISLVQGPKLVVQKQSGGPDVVVVPLRGLDIAQGLGRLIRSPDSQLAPKSLVSSPRRSSSRALVFSNAICSTLVSGSLRHHCCSGVMSSVARRRAYKEFTSAMMMSRIVWSGHPMFLRLAM